MQSSLISHALASPLTLSLLPPVFPPPPSFVTYHFWMLQPRVTVPIRPSSVRSWLLRYVCFIPRRFPCASSSPPRKPARRTPALLILCFFAPVMVLTSAGIREILFRPSTLPRPESCRKRKGDRGKAGEKGVRGWAPALFDLNFRGTSDPWENYTDGGP